MILYGIIELLIKILWECLLTKWFMEKIGDAMTGTVAALAGLCGGPIVVGTENASANGIWVAGTGFGRRGNLDLVEVQRPLSSPSVNWC